MHRLTKPWFVLTVAALIVAGTGGCSKQARKVRHLAQGDKYYAAGQYPEAEVEYLNAMKADVTDPHAIGRLGVIYFEQGRLARAYPFLMRAYELDRNDLMVRLKVGLLQLASGNARDARAEAMAVLASDPRNPDAPMLLAETARSQADVEEIRQQFEALLKQTGDTAPLNTGLGSVLLRGGDRKGAETAFRHAVELDPRCSPAHYALGLIRLSQNSLTNADAEFKAAAESAPRRSVRRLDYADFKLKTGDITEARRILTQLTKDVPDYVPPWTALGRIALAQKQYDECGALVQKALARDPDNYDALALSAALRLTRGEVDAAINELERVTALYKGAPQSRYTLALAYLAKGDSAKAMKNLKDALALNPQYEDAILLQAQLNIRRDEADTAIASLTDLIQRRPTLATAYLLLGAAYSTTGNLDAALATYQQLGNAYPSNAQVPLLIGAVLQQQGKKDDARRAFEKSLELAPGNPGAVEQLAYLDLSLGQYAAATLRIQSEIEKQPQSPQLHLLLAQVFIQQKDFDQSEKTLKKAIELDPGFLAAYLKLAMVYRDSSRNAEALEKLNQILARDPRNVSALMLVGIIQNEQHNYSAARAAYEKLLAVNPNFSPALNNVAYLYSEQFNLPDKAYEAARRARDLLPYDPATADTLGWVLFKRGNYAWALSLLQESAEKFPDEPDVQFHLGMAYYMTDDEPRARKTLNHVLALNKAFAGKETAAQRVAMLDLDGQTAGPDAIATLEARLREQPDDPVALSRVARVYERQGVPGKAVTNYEYALKQNPKNAPLLIDLAGLYASHLHDSARALALAKDAYKLAPDDPGISCSLGRLALASGDGKWALSLLQQSAQRQKLQPDQLFDLATAYYSVGRVPDAGSTMRNALQADASFPRAAEAKQFLELIALPADSAKAAAALPQVRQILQTDPANVPALMVLATASEQRDGPAAARTYEDVLKRYPDFVPAIKRLAILKAARPGEEQQAYDLAVKAREALPDDAELAKVLGITLYRRGDSRSAVRYLTECAQKGVADGETLYYLGMGHYRLKQPNESRAALRRALELNLAAPLADEARRVLAELK